MGKVSKSWNVPDDKVELMKLLTNDIAKAGLYEAAKARGATLPQLQKAKFTVVPDKSNGTADLVLEWKDDDGK